MIRTFFLCLAGLQISAVIAEHKKTDPRKEEVGFNSFKEIGQALDEQMNILSEIFEKDSSFGMVPNQGTSQNILDVHIGDDSIKITTYVPAVENSELIKAHFNAAQKSLKVIIPQKDRVTKIVIKSYDDQTSIKQVLKQRAEEKREGKNSHSFYMNSRKQVTYKTLPFAVSLSERTVEYKDNDILVITLHKAPVSSIKKAQPRMIPVTNK